MSGSACATSRCASSTISSATGQAAEVIVSRTFSSEPCTSIPHTRPSATMSSAVSGSITRRNAASASASGSDTAQILERIALQRFVEFSERLAERALEAPAPGQPAAIVLAVEAFGRKVSALGQPHHAPDIDGVGRTRELDAAAAPARVAEQPFPAEEVHHLHHMRFRDSEEPSHLGNRGAALGCVGKVHEHPQAVVGEGGGAHGYFASPSASCGAGLRPPPLSSLAA